MATVQAVSRPKVPGQVSPASGSSVHEKARAGEDRYRMIAEAAYFRAERRGFVAGSELQDWLAAEIEVDELLGESDPR